jgi:predicted RecA/RadA family phage recombinase
MATNFAQPGETMTITAGADLVSGQVVKVGQSLCVALQDIASGATGVVARVGVFTVPKVSAAVIAQGERLVWDVSATPPAFDDNAATPATGDVTGEAAVAFEAAGNGVTSMKVYFTGVPGLVT